MNKPPMRYITRVEPSSSSSFYWVRFLRAKQRYHEAQKTFLDSRYGGKKKALQAAQQWRDEMVLLLRKSPHPNRSKYAKAPHSNTGVVGVSLLDYMRHTDTREYHVLGYATQWTETNDGERKAKHRFFKFKAGDVSDQERAFRSAKRWRKRMEKTHYIGARDIYKAR